MRITSSIEYATRLMTTLARAYGQAPLAAERLAASDNIPSDYVSQILVKLRRAGLVTSHRGSSGGYGLSRPPAEITLGAVVRAVDGLDLAVGGHGQRLVQRLVVLPVDGRAALGAGARRQAGARERHGAGQAGGVQREGAPVHAAPQTLLRSWATSTSVVARHSLPPFIDGPVV